jgi:hypothetical protein
LKIKNQGNNESERAQKKSSFHNKLLESLNKMAKAGEGSGRFKKKFFLQLGMFRFYLDKSDSFFLQRQWVFTCQWNKTNFLHCQQCKKVKQICVPLMEDSSS